MSKKISFILVAILCMSFIFFNQIYLNVQANDYVIYNLKNPPSVTGDLLSSHTSISTSEFWRHSGGEWSYTPIVGGAPTETLSDSQMDQIIQNQTVEQDFIISTDLPYAVRNYIDSGRNDLKVKIKQSNEKNYVEGNALTRFQYKIDTANKKIYLKFQPQLNIDKDSNLWEGSPSENYVIPLPMVIEGYGTNMFSVFEKAGNDNRELEYGLDDPRKLQSPNEVSADGSLLEGKTYIRSDGVEFDGSNYRIGRDSGIFHSGGAMGIKFLFSFDIEYYTPIEGDFKIYAEGSDVTDSNYQVNIPDTDYGRRNHRVTLEYIGPSEGVERVEWTNSHGHKLIASGSNLRTEGQVYGDEYPGQTNNFNMVVYYTNGSQYPRSGDPPISHYVNVIEEYINEGGASGDITFNPNSSSNISGNRENWVNNNINVNVRVVGDTIITASGSTSWGYTYRIRKTDPETGEEYWENRSGTSTRRFTETWRISSFRVWGSGRNASGGASSLSSRTINGTSGNYSISSELRNIVLQAEVTNWESSSRSWNSGSAPSGGSWNSGSPPSGRTTKPSEKYSSQSGTYFLDKSSPTLTALNPSSRGWTNNTITVPVTIKDNLSGFWRDNTYFEIIDTSYLRQSTIKQNFQKGSNSETKNAVINKDGIYNIKVYAEDIARNRMTNKTYGLYKYDSTSPYAATFSSDNRSYIDEDLRITVTVGDNLSGITETRYVLNNSPTSSLGMSSVNVTTADGRNDYSSFDVNITEPGSWWIHVYQKDRAGNTRTTTSPEYKIVRLGDKNNRSGKTYYNEDNISIWIGPKSIVPRATRFDVISKTYGLTRDEAANSTVYVKVPAWVNDDIDRKANGKYVITAGTVTQTMNYCSGLEEGPQGYATPSTVVQWWRAYIPPYGTQVSLNREKTRVREQYEFEIYLQFDGYSPRRTHTSKVKFDICPDTKIKTQIINNEF